MAHSGLFWQESFLIVLNRDISEREKPVKTGGVETLLKKHRERVEFFNEQKFFYYVLRDRYAYLIYSRILVWL